MRLFCCTLTLLLCTLTAGNALAEHRLGGGVNYWVMLKDLDDKDFDDKGLSYLVSYQYWKGPFGVELAGELLPKRLDETALAPQAYLLFGGTGPTVAAYPIRWRSARPRFGADRHRR